MQAEAISEGASTHGAADENGAQFLTFMLDGSEYGLEILRVQEIKGWDNVTPIPNTPDHLRGVINLRGTVVPVIDLRLRFGLPSIEFTSTTVVIIVKVEHQDKTQTFGFVVDAVSEVYTVSHDQIKPAPEVGSEGGSEFVSSLITVHDEKMVILLDIDNLVSADLLTQVE